MTPDPVAGQRSDIPIGAAGKVVFQPEKALAERALNADMDHHLARNGGIGTSGPGGVRSRSLGRFLTDEAALKLLYLVLHRTGKAWTMPRREWRMDKAQLAVLFGERFTISNRPLTAHDGQASMTSECQVCLTVNLADLMIWSLWFFTRLGA
jgi:putative transposase